MNKRLSKFLFLLTLGLILFAPSETYANPESQYEDTETDRVIVKVTDASGNATVKSITWKEFETLNRRYFVRAASTVSDLQKVEMLEPDYIRNTGVMAGSVEVKSWGTERIGTKEMQKKITSDKENVIVAVIDTGVDYTHSLLKNRVVNGYDFVDNDSDPMDVHYHGTHVAGIIADSTPESVKIMPIRALNEKANGYDTNIAKSIRFAVDNGASVINMSLGGEKYSNHLAGAMNYALLNNVLVVVSSGNDGSNTANYYPASEQKVIVVSATDQYDNVTRFSNTGATVDLSAPGVGIVSSIPGERYGSMNGTSMATPFVSGAAAMMKLDDPTRSIQEIEGLVKKYTDDRGAISWDPLFGEGIVNVTTYENISLLKQPSIPADYIALPGQKNVPLDKKWSIKFNKEFSDDTIVTIKLYDKDKEIPVSLSNNLKNKEIIVIPDMKYERYHAYHLEIIVKNGKKYQMQFVTTSSS